jgi:hypothetical protein
MQRTQFCAKNAKNDLKPTNFLKRNLYFEMEGVHSKLHSITLVATKLHVILRSYVVLTCMRDTSELA